MDLSGIEVGFEYGPESETVQREIIRNVETLLLTPIGTCPLYRHFGLDVTYLDFPPEVAKGLFTVAAIDAIERWEPRVRVKSVSFTGDAVNGKLGAKVVLTGGRLTKIGL